MYTADEFNTENAPKEMVQYVIDNVLDFDIRYQCALNIIRRDRCPLRMADLCLYTEIEDMIIEWCDLESSIKDKHIWADDYDIEEIFG